MTQTPKILCIETGGDICSVAVFNGKQLLSEEKNNNREHAKYLSVIIDKILKNHNLNYSDIDAVAISKGPGSYTGLRIGTATAKGICYGTGKPLVSINSLKALAAVHNNKKTDTFYCPMLDARRAEVYTAVYDWQLNEIMPTQAKIIDETSFIDILNKQQIVFFGSGAAKCKDIILHPNATFAQVESSATGMGYFAFEAYIQKSFEDIAYFEPFYLKDYVVTQSKKQIK